MSLVHKPAFDASRGTQLYAESRRKLAITEQSIYCRTCGYHLDFAPENCCSECGTVFDPENADTYDINPSAYLYRLWRRRVATVWVFVPLVWLIYYLNLNGFGVLVLIAGFCLLIYEKRWSTIGATAILSPVTLFFSYGINDYWQETAYLRFRGFPTNESINVHPVFRCRQMTGGCVVRGGEGLQDASYNAGLCLMISLFGPMDGSYVGPYPSKREAIAILVNGQIIPVQQIFDDEIKVSGSTVRLRNGLGKQLLAQTEWSFLLTPMDEDYIKENFPKTGPIKGSLFQNTCLVLRIPSSIEADCETAEQPCTTIALIDTVTGKLFACYGETGRESTKMLTRWK